MAPVVVRRCQVKNRRRNEKKLIQMRVYFGTAASSRSTIQIRGACLSSKKSSASVNFFLHSRLKNRNLFLEIETALMQTGLAPNAFTFDLPVA